MSYTIKKTTRQGDPHYSCSDHYISWSLIYKSRNWIILSLDIEKIFSILSLQVLQGLFLITKVGLNSSWGSQAHVYCRKRTCKNYFSGGQKYPHRSACCNECAHKCSCCF
ncbi:hypothetical protein KP509_12G008200 [Ceratopteris richardii]|uniref:Uncharacterized protein n=1 Tax=Ceratopteris richardii TaxID=49495 RepID=A0A8T2TIW4_CERRI|nr:hypothetical protein KP509_12G008200 [Ceratopteris richardii]